jgi:hypothetical protein
MCVQCGCINDPPGVSAANWNASSIDRQAQRIDELERRVWMLEARLAILAHSKST